MKKSKNLLLIEHGKYLIINEDGTARYSDNPKFKPVYNEPIIRQPSKQVRPLKSE